MTTVVVGAGIVGTAIAHDLQKRGRQVVLLDLDAPGKGASFGNMASIAVTEFMPPSRPSVWKQMPGWMLDPKAPVRVRPSYMPKLVPWFLGFIAASLPSKLWVLEVQGATLCGRALGAALNLLREMGLEGQISNEGRLSLYADEAEFRADREHIEVLERFGFPHEVIGRQAIKGKVVGFTRSNAMREVVLRDSRRLPADEVVICAGAYSAKLAKDLGEPMTLETERGCHTQITAPGMSMKHSIIWPAKAFMVTPTAGCIGVGGTVEKAGLGVAPDYRRAKMTVKRAKEALPNLRCRDFPEWTGHRPALADTVPILSASAKTKGLFHATGRGHLGLTYAATTARLMGELIAGGRPSVNLHALRVNRF